MPGSVACGHGKDNWQRRTANCTGPSKRKWGETGHFGGQRGRGILRRIGQMCDMLNVGEGRRSPETQDMRPSPLQLPSWAFKGCQCQDSELTALPCYSPKSQHYTSWIYVHGGVSCFSKSASLQLSCVGISIGPGSHHARHLPEPSPRKRPCQPTLQGLSRGERVPAPYCVRHLATWDPGKSSVLQGRSPGL